MNNLPEFAELETFGVCGTAGEEKHFHCHHDGKLTVSLFLTIELLNSIPVSTLRQ